jgi:hypothetical protein
LAFGPLASETAVVEHAVLEAVLVAEALGVHTSVVVVEVGLRAYGVPLDTVPSVTVTTESPLTVDMDIVALR